MMILLRLTCWTLFASLGMALLHPVADNIWNGTCQHLINRDLCVMDKSKVNDIIYIDSDHPCNFTCSYKSLKEGPIRLTVRMRSSWVNSDVFVSVQQNHDISAYHLPFIFSDLEKHQPFTTLEKTFCPPQDPKDTLYVRITAFKFTNISIDLKPTPNTILKNLNITTNPTPVKATVLHYSWEENESSVLIIATDSSKQRFVCALFSLQNGKCPYHTDQASILSSGGKYQTILGKGGLIGKRDMFPDGINIVVLPLPSNDMCGNTVQDHNATSRTKELVISVHTHHSFSQSWGIFVGIAIFFIILTFGVTYFSKFAISRHFENLKEDDSQSLFNFGLTAHLNLYVDTLEDESSEPDTNEQADDVNLLVANESPTLMPSPQLAILQASDNSQVQLPVQQERVVCDQDVMNFTPSFNPRFVFWWKSYKLCNSLNAPQSGSEDFQKNLVLIGLFMLLPFAELLRSYLNIYSNHGAEDQCHFNSLCMTSWWIFNDFARIFTNVGFLLCGGCLLYIIHRHQHHTDALANRFKNHPIGVSHNYELFKAMAYSMIIQCVMSSLYHVCPNEVTIRFDMLFIYVMAILIIIGTWGLRHGNVSNHAYSSIGLIGTMLIFAELQDWLPLWLFWLIFGAIQSIIGFTTTYCLVKYGDWSFSPFGIVKILKKWNPILRRLKNILENQMEESAFSLKILRPLFGLTANSVLLFIGAFYNMEIYKYILTLCLFFMASYLINYFVTKKVHKEKYTPLTLVMLTSSMILWIPSIIFFLLKNTDSELSPSYSRLLNGECVLFGILSYHDLWHLFSSFAIFLSVIGILTLDDDLANIPSERIPVF